MTIREFLRATMNNQLTLDQQKNFLKTKPFGEPEELADAVNYLYTRMAPAPDLHDAIDVCGTGGSGLDKINVSTLSAFIAAACDIKVAKHGNNAASGKFGSFDLLSALDIPINLSSDELKLRYKQHNLAFLYAKNFHPVMRFFAPVRSEINQPTFFNILGPLLSPIKANKQIIGTVNEHYAELIVKTAKIMGKKNVIVLYGQGGIDEVSLSGPTKIFELKNGKIRDYQITPQDFGVKPIKNFSEIKVSDIDQRIKLSLLILSGKDKSANTDFVLINSALVLFLAGKSENLAECYNISKEILLSGKAQETLENYRRPSFLTQIKNDDKKRNFKPDPVFKIEIMHKPVKYTGGLIAEIKEASPSEGFINKNVNYQELSKIYTKSGASAISVLCEPKYFNGNFNKLSKARSATHLPILCKDFILRTEHIDQAKAVGADIILLIVGLLNDDQLKKLYDYASGIGLQILVEVHTEDELKRALKIKPKIIGVNSRNLHDFSIDREIFEKLKNQIPKNIIKVAESGIKNFKDIPKGYNGILVGTEIMQHPFAKLKIKELSGKPIIKLCGIRSVQQAKLCEQLGVDLIGINFVPRSKRRVDLSEAKKIASVCKTTIPVGVFENQSPEDVNYICKKTGVSAVQLSGNEKDLGKYNLPIIKTVQLGQLKPDQAFMTIIDNKMPGSGKTFDHKLLTQFEPSLIAGGINLVTMKSLLADKKPLGIDTASGIETNGQVDMQKIKAFASVAQELSYD